MPTINIPQDDTTTSSSNTAPAVSTPVSTPTQQNTNGFGQNNQQPFSPWGNDPWGMGNGGGFGGGLNSSGQSNGAKKLTPQERVGLIEKIFEEILGRKADTRDINYYKYSTLSEEEMRKQLLTGKEHKQLLDDGREYKKMKERATQAETRVKMLESQIKDQVMEFQHLTKLLDEKNKHIQQLRGSNRNPYNFVNPEPIQAPRSGSETQFSAPMGEKEVEIKSVKENVSILDRFKAILP